MIYVCRPTGTLSIPGVYGGLVDKVPFWNGDEQGVDMEDGCVYVNAGELYVVPRGVEHRTAAQGEAKVLMIEPRGVLNTGKEGGERTAENDIWI